MYLLKFVKVPKEVKKLKVVPKKWLYLPRAQAVYQQVIEKGSYDGKISLLVRKQDSQQDVEIEIIYQEGFALSDLIQQDLFEGIRDASDEKERMFLEIMENELMLSFEEPIDEKEETPQSAINPLLSKIGELVPFKKKTASNTVEALPETPEGSAQISEIGTIPPSSGEQKEEEALLEYDPDYGDDQEQDQELVLQGELDPPIQVETRQDNRIDSSMSKEIKEPTTELPALQEYIAVEGLPVFHEIEQQIAHIETLKAKGSAYVLAELGLEAPETYIDKEQKEFIEKQYTKGYYSELITSLVEAKSNMLNTAILSLTQKYEAVVNRPVDPELYEEKETIRAEIESRFESEITTKRRQISERYSQLSNQLKVKQEEELNQLKRRHEEETTRLNNAQATEKEQDENDLREKSAREIKQTCDAFWQGALRKKEMKDRQSLETYRITQYESLRTSVADTMKTIKEKEEGYLKTLRTSLANVQPRLEQKYQQYLADEQRKREQEKQQEELALKAREVSVEEKKVSLEEKAIRETIDSTARMEKQNKELLLAQHNQLVETMRLLQSGQAPTIQNSEMNQDNQQLKSPWWKGFFVATAVFVTIGGIGTLLYSIHNVYAAQEQTTQVIQKQTEEMEQRLMGVIEEYSRQEAIQGEAQEKTSLETFEDYLSEEQYVSAAEVFPDKQEAIIDYLIAQGDQENLNLFLSEYPTQDPLLLLKYAILEGNNEEILTHYYKNETSALKQLAKEQKQIVALALYQAGCFDAANDLLRE